MKTEFRAFWVLPRQLESAARLALWTMIMIEFLLMRRYSIRMRLEEYRAQDLIELFRKNKIATMPELKAILGTQADATIFRKLRELSYRSSYSHRGRYYTLDDIANYDEWGLWSYRTVWFSLRGSLMATAEALVEESGAGFFVAELENVLNVEAKGALLKLMRQGRLSREQITGRYLYCSQEPATKKLQLRARRVLEAGSLPAGRIPHVDVLPDELKASIVLFFSLLDEKQRRLYAGLESLKIGHGGDRAMAELLGLGVGTVSHGRRELLDRNVEPERVRRTGAGRKSVEKKRRRSSRASKS